MTRTLPDGIYEIIDAAAREHSDDLTVAVQEASQQVWDLLRVKVTGDADDKEALRELVRIAVAQLIYRDRHYDNQSMRAENRVEPAARDCSPKIRINGDIAREAAAEVQSFYEFKIAGRTLGRILGKELPGIAQGQWAQSRGSAFNARLAEELTPLVDPEKPVQQCVKETEIRSIARKIEREQKVPAVTGNGHVNGSRNGDNGVVTEAAGAVPSTNGKGKH